MVHTGAVVLCGECADTAQGLRGDTRDARIIGADSELAHQSGAA